MLARSHACLVMKPWPRLRRPRRPSLAW